MEDACGTSPALPPAGRRCLPKQTCFVSELSFVFFNSPHLSSIPVHFTFDGALRKS